MRIQAGLVYAVATLSVSIFVLYLGFMTHYYALFYDGTDEMYEFYKLLQVFNKDAFEAGSTGESINITFSLLSLRSRLSKGLER